MNYRHAFHAGNFADVVKHAVLARIVAYLQRKDAPGLADGLRNAVAPAREALLALVDLYGDAEGAESAIARGRTALPRLPAIGAALDTLERRSMARDAARASHGRALARYAAGDIALVELLAAERSGHEAQTMVVRAHTSAALQLVALYKALGGGWEAPAAMPQRSIP